MLIQPCFGKIPHNLVTEDHFSYVEINHLYDANTGRFLLDQIIFYDWVIDGYTLNKTTEKQVVQAWILIKNARFLSVKKDDGVMEIVFHPQNSQYSDEYKKLNKEFKDKQEKKHLTKVKKELIERYGKILAEVKFKRIKDKKLYSIKIVDYVPPFIGSSMVPTKIGNKYMCVFHHGKVLRRITCDSFVETWTTIDPETLNRDFWGKDNRKGLTKPDRGLMWLLEEQKKAQKPN
jgi:hypothetical protein